MIPLFLKIKIPRKGKSPVTLYLPLFLLWLLLLPFFLALFFLYLLTILIAWPMGYARLVMISLPMILSILWNLQGLKIDVQEKQQQFHISFI